MKEAILYDQDEYVGQIADIIDRRNADVFADTSILVQEPAMYFDPTGRKYESFNFSTLFRSLLHVSTTPNFKSLKSEIISNNQVFQSNMIELAIDELMVTPYIFSEIASSKDYINMMYDQQFRKIHEPINMHYTKQGKHTVNYADKNPVNTFLFRKDVPHQKISHKNYTKTINAMIEILATIKPYEEKLEEIYAPMNESMTNLKQHHTDLFLDIADATQAAFDRYRKINVSKSHKNSNDSKILAELLLYSHINDKPVVFITGDMDFSGIIKELNGKTIDDYIGPNLTLANRITPYDFSTPFFNEAIYLTYSDKFEVGHKKLEKYVRNVI